jgi:hypothetical protein
MVGTVMRYRFVAPMLAALALTPALVSGVSAGADGPPNYQLDDTLNVVAQQAADDLGLLLSAPLIQTLVSQSLLGMAVVPSGLEVSLASPAPALLSFIPSTVDGVPVSVREVTQSATTLNTVADSIQNDYGTWQSQGVTIGAFGPDYATDKVVVYLQEYNPDAAASIVNAYGAGNVTVSPTPLTVQPASRTNDTAPWYGGDRINRVSSSGTTLCTSFFPMALKSNGAAESLTAGHCGSGTWREGLGSAAYGSTTTVHFGNTSTDAELIPVSSDAQYMWVDPTFTTRTITAYATTDAVNGVIATDGATTGEVGGVIIEQTGVRVCYLNQCTTGQVYACQRNGTTAIQEGDSGGPVITGLVNARAEARGMIIAMATNNNSCGFYTPIVTIMNAFGVVPKLGT